MSTGGAQPDLGLKASISDASRKIESIIDDAERAAAEIRSAARVDAEREAAQALDRISSDLAAIVRPLIERVENLRVEGAALMHEIETATAKLTDIPKVSRTFSASETPEASPAPPAPAPEPEPVSGPLVEDSPKPVAPEPPKKPERGERVGPVVASSTPGPMPVAYPGRESARSVTATSEDAVLRATQMAVAGSSREEIETSLRDEFGLKDASPVVNDILGEA